MLGAVGIGARASGTGTGAGAATAGSGVTEADGGGAVAQPAIDPRKIRRQAIRGGRSRGGRAEERQVISGF